MDVNSAAPVVGSAEAVIEAPVELVWAVLSDLEGWPKWNRSVTRIRLKGPLAVGTSFTWVGGGSKIVSRLEEIDKPSRIVWSGRTLGIRAVHVWRFRVVELGTLVQTEESFDGLVVKFLPGLMRRMLDKALREGIEALKAEAEARRARSGDGNGPA